MKSKINVISEIVDKVSFILHGAGAFCLVLITIMIGAEIASRNFFDYSFSIVWEGGSYLLGASWFLSAAYTLRTDGHIRIQLFNRFLGSKGNRIVDIAASIIGIAICAVFFSALLQLTINSFTAHKTSFTPMQTPLFIPQAVFALGMLGMLVQMIMRLFLLLCHMAPDLKQENPVTEELH